MESETTPSINSRALAVLRTLRDWGQKELGRAAGLDADTISAYERRHEPGLDKLYHFGALMGFPPSFVERARSFVGAGLEWCRSTGDGEADAAARQEMELLAAGEAARYEEFLGRTLAALDRAVETRFERREAPRLWRRLRRHPSARRPAVVQLDEEFWSWGLCELLCEESTRAAAREPGEALALARLAEEVARQVPGSAAWRSRLAGFAGFFAGNALRVQGSLREADDAFRAADALWRQGVADDPERLDPSRPFDLEASLRRAQRSLPGAMKLLDRALELARDDAAFGRIYLKKAKSCEEMGDYARAIDTLRRARPHVERSGDARLLFALRFNALDNEVQAGRPVDVPARLAEVQELAVRLGNGLDSVRVRWLEGRLATRMGRRGEAEAAFREVQAALERRRMPYDTALVLLELAVLLLEEGRAAEVRRLAGPLETLFAAEGVHREALAALGLFHRAALAEEATADLARSVLDFLRRSRHDGAMRFRPPAGEPPAPTDGPGESPNPED